MPERNLSTRSLTVPLRRKSQSVLGNDALLVDSRGELIARFQPFFAFLAVKRQDAGGCGIQFTHLLKNSKANRRSAIVKISRELERLSGSGSTAERCAGNGRGFLAIRHDITSELPLARLVPNSPCIRQVENALACVRDPRDERADRDNAVQEITMKSTPTNEQGEATPPPPRRFRKTGPR